MGAILSNLRNTVIAGIVVLVVMVAIVANVTGEGMPGGHAYWTFVMRFLHVASGVMWIGLLYYFNFVQVPAMGAALADKDGPGPAAIGKYVAPRALLWFRWSALVPWIAGAGLLGPNFVAAFTLHGAFVNIGLGAWLGTIMLLNVWGVIWPNQKKILGMVEATAEEIAKAKRTALLASRTNTMLSIPMLFFMASHTHGVM